MAYKPQYYPGNTSVARNRRKHISNKVEKLRDISDEDLTAILGHRAPGSDYPSTHPPLAEMGEPDCSIREIVEPTPGAAAGDRVRYVQFSDSMYNAPATPYWRSYHAAMNFRGVDPGTLSGRQIVEMRERDLEAFAKRVSETEITDWGLAGMRGCTVHGHSLRLQEDGVMFDMLDRRRLENGVIVMDKDQVGVPIDRKVNLGKQMSEAEAARRTTIYRVDNVPFRNDKEVIEHVQRVWEQRTRGVSLSSNLNNICGKEHELDIPDWRGTPIYMRNIKGTGELFVVSETGTSSDRDYYLYTILFDHEKGFYDIGRTLDNDLGSARGILQVIALENKNLVFLLLDHGVQVYRTSHSNYPPEVNFVCVLHSGEDIRAIGNDPSFTTLVSLKGDIYVYRYNDVTGDVELVPNSCDIKSRFGDGTSVEYANVLSGMDVLSNLLIYEARSGLFHLSLQSNGPKVSCKFYPVLPYDESNKYIGRMHVELKWNVGPGCVNGIIHHGEWASFVITGNSAWIKIYYFFPGIWRYSLVKYKDSTGKLNDRYIFPMSRDWDVKFKDNDYKGILYMIASLDSGKLLANTLDMTLNLDGESYFQVRSEYLDPKGDVSCVFWADDSTTSLINPRFEILSNGRLRFKGTTMPEPINPNHLEKVNYGITVITSDIENAGTNAKVFITIFGTKHDSEEIHLPDPDNSKFERGNTDHFDVVLPFLGDLKKVRIRHNPGRTENQPGWHLDRIIVKDQLLGIEWVFICKMWLAEDEGDRKIDRYLEVAPP